MHIINPEHWAYKLYNEDGGKQSIVYYLMNCHILSCGNKYYIYLNKRGNIYIFRKQKKSLEIIKKEQGEPLKLPYKCLVPDGYETEEYDFNTRIKTYTKIINKYNDFEIYYAITDDIVIPEKYFLTIRDYIRKLNTIDDIIYSLKYIKLKIRNKI